VGVGVYAYDDSATAGCVYVSGCAAAVVVVEL